MSKSEIGANRLDDAARAGPLNHIAALTLEEVGVKVDVQFTHLASWSTS